MPPPYGPIMAIVLASACHMPGEDLVYGTYSGFFDDADLDPGISVEKANTSFTLVLEPGEEGAVAGRATMRGKTRGPLGVFDGKETTEIADVRINGEELRCIYTRDGFGLRIKGFFGRDFTELELDVPYVGVLFLEREEEDTGAE